MVSLVPMAHPSAPSVAIKSTKPLLRRSKTSGTIRKLGDTDFDSDLLSVPSSPNKRARVTFNPNVEEKVVEAYKARGRSLDLVRAEVKMAIQAHLKGDSEGYDIIKAAFSPKAADEEEDEDEDDEGKRADLKAYLYALTGYTSMLNKSCSGMVKAILACEWMGRDESFVKAYVHFLGSLASAQGAYVGMVLGMLVGHFPGGKTFRFSLYGRLTDLYFSSSIMRSSCRICRCQSRAALVEIAHRFKIPSPTYSLGQ